MIKAGQTLIAAGICAALALAAWLAIQESERWNEFKIEHHCRVVSHISSSMFNTFGIDSKGNPVIGIGSTPEKTGWLCDDGVIYYK